MPTLNTVPTRSDAELTDPVIQSELKHLLMTRRSGVLGTSRADIPLCSQMAFAATSRFDILLVLTPRQSAKYVNIIANPHVSFLISTTENSPEDPILARILTAQGKAREATDERRAELMPLFLNKHPELHTFTEAPTSALIEIHVISYDLVRDFQQITHIRL